jgi:hypothetical protein
MTPPRATLADVVKALGGDLYDGGRRAVTPGPGHSPRDRSVSLLLSGGRVLAHSFAGDDWRTVLDDLRRRGLIDGMGRLKGGVSSEIVSRPSRPERLAAASVLWSQARPVAGTLAERHARLRGVTRDLPAALRFHVAAPAAVYQDRGPRRPALLAEIRDAAGRFAGLELTYLACDGGRASVAIPRKTIGGRPAGSAVRLDPAASEMLVGEGVFSCLSASQVLGLPAWALLAIGNLRGWAPPAGVRRVVIASDRGAPGEAGAAALAARLRGRGVRVEVRPPPAGYADWNDAVRGGSGRGGGGGRTGSGG